MVYNYAPTESRDDIPLKNSRITSELFKALPRHPWQRVRTGLLGLGLLGLGLLGLGLLGLGLRRVRFLFLAIGSPS